MYSGERENDCFMALGWTPDGQRVRGRPKTTWRRTVERERNKAGWKSWNVKPRQWYRTESVGLMRMCRPYAPTGMGRIIIIDDESLFLPAYIQAI